MIRVVKHALFDTRRWAGVIILIGIAAGICVASLLNGGSGISGREALQALFSSAGTSGVDEIARNVMVEVRVPRLLAALGVGGLLSLAGVLLQALFRNPLADPYVLGVSGGAAVGAVLAMVMGAGVAAGLAGVGAVHLAAMVGALVSVGLVYGLARGGGTARLLLTGV